MRFRKMRDVIAPALLLFALLVPSAAKGQTTTDNFFYINDGEYRGGDDAGSWNGFGFGGAAAENHASWNGYELTQYNTENGALWDGFELTQYDTGNSASWEGFEYGDPLPIGTGLLVLVLSGMCYVMLKVRRVLGVKN